MCVGDIHNVCGLFLILGEDLILCRSPNFTYLLCGHKTYLIFSIKM